jgi:triacylglycerol esterase/lipase EstA (alpha/beta hydrolase family)
VVGHSLGGVIARLWLQELGGRARAVSFTTLSSPHQGLAGVPAAGLVPVIRDLLPGSPTLARLEQGAAALDGLPCLSLVSSRDHFVRPWQRAGFAGARLQPVAEAGHVGLLFSKEVAGLIADHLESVG